MTEPRAKVACINWSHPDAPHAVSYVLRDDEAIAISYHPTWSEAMHRSTALAEWIQALRTRVER